MSNTELQSELARVVELLEKATPGEWSVEPLWHERCGGDVSIVNREHGGDDWDICTVHSTEANALLIPAAINFLRKHGASLLSSHGVGGEAVAWGVRCHTDGKLWMADTSISHASRQAEENDDTLVALYEHPPTPSAQAPTGGGEVVGEVIGYGRLSGEPRVSLVDGLAPGTKLYTAASPQPRAEGMVLVPREPNQAMIDRGNEALSTPDFSDADSSAVYAAMLAAAPGEGSGEDAAEAYRQAHNAGEAHGRNMAALDSATPPPASQPASYKPLHGDRCIQEVR